MFRKKCVVHPAEGSQHFERTLLFQLVFHIHLFNVHIHLFNVSQANIRDKLTAITIDLLYELIDQPAGPDELLPVLDQYIPTLTKGYVSDSVRP